MIQISNLPPSKTMHADPKADCSASRSGKGHDTDQSISNFATTAPLGLGNVTSLRLMHGRGSTGTSVPADVHAYPRGIESRPARVVLWSASGRHVSVAMYEFVRVRHQ